MVRVAIIYQRVLASLSCVQRFVVLVLTISTKIHEPIGGTGHAFIAVQEALLGVGAHVRGAVLMLLYPISL